MHTISKETETDENSTPPPPKGSHLAPLGPGLLRMGSVEGRDEGWVQNKPSGYPAPATQAHTPPSLPDTGNLYPSGECPGSGAPSTRCTCGGGVAGGHSGLDVTGFTWETWKTG